MINHCIDKTISVVIPCFNDGHYLPKLLEHLFKQSLPPSEVLVIDDASTNETPQILASLAKSYPRLQVHRNFENLGVIRSINKGVELATGKFIYMTGCDDFPLQGLFEKSVAMLSEHPQTSLCFSNPCSWEEGTVAVNEHLPSTFKQQSGYLKPEEAAVALSGMPFVHPHSGLISRQALIEIGIYDPALEASADWFSWLTLIFRKGCCYLPEPLSLWRTRKDSYLATAFADKQRKLKIIERAFEKVLAPDFSDIYPHFVTSNAFTIFGTIASKFYSKNRKKLGERGKALLRWKPNGSHAWSRTAVPLRIWRLDLNSIQLLSPLPHGFPANGKQSDTNETPPPIFITPRYVFMIADIARALGIGRPLRNLRWFFFDPLTRSLRSPTELTRMLLKKNKFSNLLSKYASDTPPANLQNLTAIDDGDLDVKISSLRLRLSSTADGSEKLALWGMLAAAQLNNAQCQQAIETFKNFENSGLCTPRIALERYIAHACQEQSESAVEFLRSVLAQHPAISSARALLGMELEHQGFSVDANAEFNIVRSISTEDFEALSEAAHLLYSAHGQRERSITCWKILFREKQSSLVVNNIQVFDVPWTVAIGHFAILDAYLKASILGIVPYKKRVLLARDGIYPDSKDPYVSNRGILELFKPVIELVESRSELANYEKLGVSVCQPMTVMERVGGKVDFWPLIATEAQERWEKEGRPPLIKVPENLQKHCRNALTQLGVPGESWIATLHVRDTYDRVKDKSTHARNADIQRYELAVKAVNARGGFVVRLGDKRMPEANFGSGFIDYAHSELKGDLLDILLLSQARFHIGTDSGLSILPGIFAIPCAYTNWMPPGTFSWYGNNLYILKDLLGPGGKPIPYSEQVRSPLGSCESMYYLKSNGFTVRENSANEIEELVTEMMDRLDGKIQYSQEDLAYQKAFSHLHLTYSGYGQCRLGRDYLRRRKHLLSDVY